MSEYYCFMCKQVSNPQGEWEIRTTEPSGKDYLACIPHAYCALEYLRKHSAYIDEPYIRRELTDQVFKIESEMLLRRRQEKK